MLLTSSPHSEIELPRLEIHRNYAFSSCLSWMPATRRYPRQFKSPLKPLKGSWIKYRKREICQATISENAPFVVAIGASIFSSLISTRKEDRSSMKETDSAIGTEDLRNGAMTIISFIPIFNWLGWIFAWLDTSEQRYLLYASVYLAPYVWTGFSFSSDDNWLLIFSYAACIAHTQIEIGGYPVGIDPIDELKKLREKGSFGKIQRKFSEFILSSEEHQNDLVEEDITQIDLSEFDKKLSSLKNQTTNATDQSHTSLSNESKNNAENTEDSDTI